MAEDAKKPAPEGTGTPGQKFIYNVRRLLKKETRWRAVRDFFMVCAGIVLFGYIVGFTVAVGQVVALGLHGAWRAYGEKWVTFPPILSLLGVATLYGAMLGLEGAGRLLWWPFRSVSPNAKRILELVAGALAALTMVSALLGGVAHQGYKEALEDHRPVTDADKTLSDSKAAIKKEQALIAKLSENATAVLSGLDRTATEVMNAKAQVTNTLGQLGKQQEELSRVNASLEALTKEGEDLKLQRAEIDRLLSGRYVPTRAEIARATWIDRIVGFFVGIASSIVAAWIWARWKKSARATS